MSPVRTRLVPVSLVTSFAAIVIGAIGMLVPGGAAATTVTFDYTGAPQNYTVPSSVPRVMIVALGAGGGDLTLQEGGPQPGGLGGRAVYRLGFPDGPTGLEERLLQVWVGGRGLDSGGSADDWRLAKPGGYNGGGSSGDGQAFSGGSGGGASDVRQNDFSIFDRTVVAGGGGGSTSTCAGGAGGGDTGGSSCSGAGQTGATGGTQTAGGSGGIGVVNGAPGVFNVGGDGGNNSWGTASGGGGGGGRFGGGGGDGGDDNGFEAGGGAGGSSFTPDGTGLTAGVNAGAGQVRIIWASLEVTAGGQATTGQAPRTTIGEPMSATAAVDGYQPTGQVQFSLYGPDDPTCGSAPVFQDTQTIGNSPDVQSANFTPTELGTYRWTAQYGGDGQNDPVGPQCDADANAVQVVPRTPSALTTAPASPSNVTAPRIRGTADAGSTVSVFTTDDCSGTPAATGTAAEFASPGLAVSVAANSSTSFYAKASDGGDSFCTDTPLTYVEDSVIPVATILTQPATLTNTNAAAFTYSSSEQETDFECKLDAQAFASCPADGKNYTGLSDGSHTFSLKPVDAAGNVGAVVSFTWTIDTAKPQITFTSKPPAFSNSTSATFSFTSSETGSTFECSFDEQPFTACQPDGISFTELTATTHTFRVRATDPAGNQGPVATYSWTIDLLLPQPTILTKPPALANSSSASFTYSSTEADSTFECQLDGQGFSTCPATGISYSDLVDGSHTFGVRPTDQAGNTGSAASYTWTSATARLSKVTVSGPKRIGKGRKATFTVNVTNSGTASALGLKLQVRGKGVSAARNAGTLAAGSTKTLRITVRPKKNGKIKLTFRVNSSNAGNVTVTKTAAVLKRQRAPQR